ncbi:hypothetical protein FACS189411_12100 [Bacteroidia bacterium]|nr:hypothetical protein FACS189411_12100 [Bacteroidia bacterium]
MFDWENKTAAEKVLFFDNFYGNVDVENVDANALLAFLENIFKTSSDTFLRERSLHFLCGLTLTKFSTNPFKALSLLFDIKSADEEFLIVQVIKLLFLFHSKGQNTKEIQTAIANFQNHHSAEVTSEVNFRLGLIEIGNITTALSTIELLQIVANAERFFKAATMEVENRIDADFFLHFIALQSAIYKNNYSAFETAYDEILNIVFEKQLYSLEAGDIEVEFSIYKLIEQLKRSYESSHRSNVWHYPIKELATLSDSFLQLEKYTIVDSYYHDFHSYIKTGIVQNCLDTMYQSELKNKTNLIESIDTQTEISISNDFMDYVLKLLQTKNESIQNDTQLVLALREIITNPQDVEMILTELGNNRDTSTLLNVLGDFLKRSQIGISHFETGYIIGDEVLNSLKKQIATLLPDLDMDKRNIYFGVLAQIIRYAQHSHLGYDKSKFPFLYSKQVKGGLGTDAKENHLQDSLYESLKHTSMAQYFEYEKDKVASGGRVDIIFQCNKMRIPIEIKKTEESPTIEKIEEYYIAQTQTYVSAYEQLGIFILLDLSDKGKNPIPNFKDWFNIHHLQPATKLPIKHPDYIVSVVIPGNKVLPSMMSTYK